MSTMSVVVFPTPPPTSNTLTSVQRSHLMRSTKKLASLLGSTPHFMDMPPAPSYLEWSDDEDSYYRPSSRSSTTASSSGSLGSRSRRSSSIRSPSRPGSSRSVRSTKSSSSYSSSTSYNDDCWSDNDSAKPPLLRLALASKPSIVDIKASLSPLSSSNASSSDSEEDMRYTLRLPTMSPRDSLISPAFHIPSPSTSRREKMDRLRRRLGDGVPIELVFPHDDSDDDEDIPLQSLRPVIHIPLPPPPPPTSAKPSSRSPRSRGNGIVNARDSVISSNTPHRAHRIKRKPVPKIQIESSEPVPPLPSKADLECLQSASNESAKKDRLSLILESPLEESPLEHEGMWTSVPRAIPQTERRVSLSKRFSRNLTSEWFSEDESEMLTFAEYMKMIDDMGNFTD